MRDTDSSEAWMLLTLGDDRVYRGNSGYDDHPRSLYRYDSSVQNWKNLQEGDYVVLRSTRDIIGLAQIATIEKRAGVKELQRCPTCRTTAIKTRRHKMPTYRCNNQHEFEQPAVTREPCEQFAAFFGDSFLELRQRYDAAAYRAAYVNYSGQMAMQRMRVAAVPGALRNAIQRLMKLTLNVSAEDGDDTPYNPSSLDSRRAVERQIRARRGQKEFRRTLRARFGDRCVVSGCRIVDLLEAAHISPYRGDQDNHPENGLLLRTDLHTLLDLDLLGIDPATLTVHLHPALCTGDYGAFEGALLNVGDRHPSPAALRLRWEAFRQRLNEPVAVHG
jgi:putative restriction endonuclease